MEIKIEKLEGEIKQQLFKMTCGPEAERLYELYVSKLGDKWYGKYVNVTINLPSHLPSASDWKELKGEITDFGGAFKELQAELEDQYKKNIENKNI
ncbi:hypothetical protein DER53_03505 [Parageobacillus toebii NBRC 107807]|uniref:Uncharacterized protein n=1 Tax=Parageobacillus toebii NBRC 107807 TaxID=1223503 RepID=A0A6G9J002_9BACL|nr:hypothetical protein [Parageobacillus toebii]MBB3868687.1 hypothetical protein [Parageobacillus toebii NBRC 107807]QIQ32035.1 hypothetical protein DER53_03505 [Parageobacillus toebii NBRC 107807]